MELRREQRTGETLHTAWTLPLAIETVQMMDAAKEQFKKTQALDMLSSLNGW